MKFILILLILIIVLVVSACSSKPHTVNATKIQVTSAKTIYVVNHGWHTGFVVPVKTIQEQLPQLRDRFQNTAYIEFGWGDKGFYQANEIDSGLAIPALFWPTESVVHAVAVPEPALAYFPKAQVEVLCLQSRQYSKLIAFIESSFEKDHNGQLIKLKKGKYGDSQFYQGVGDYFLMNTCNNWTAKGLSSAELDISTTFKLTADSIMNYLSENKQALTDCANHDVVDSHH